MRRSKLSFLALSLGILAVSCGDNSADEGTTQDTTLMTPDESMNTGTGAAAPAGDMNASGTDGSMMNNGTSGGSSTQSSGTMNNDAGGNNPGTGSAVKPGGNKSNVEHTDRGDRAGSAGASGDLGGTGHSTYPTATKGGTGSDKR